MSRSQVVTFRLSNDELAEIAHLAAQDGRTVSNYIRRVLAIAVAAAKAERTT